MRFKITTCSSAASTRRWRFACYVLVPSPASTSASVVSCIVIAVVGAAAVVVVVR